MPASQAEPFWVVNWSTDRDGLCHSIDPDWLQFTGQDIDAAKGEGWLELVHEDDRERLRANFIEARRTGCPFQLIIKIRRYNGRYSSVMAVGSPQRNRESEIGGFTGSIFNFHQTLKGQILESFGATNTTLRKNTGQVSSKSEDRLRRVLETDAVGVLFFNQDGVLVDANDVFLRTTGYTREEVEARALDWRKMTPPEYVAASEEQLRQFSTTGRIGPYEKEYFLKDGTRRWMLFAGRDLGDGTIAEYCVDISDRKRAEAALRESEEKFRVLFESIDEGFFRAEVAFDDSGKPVDLLFLDTNPAAIKLSGRNFVGHWMREIDPEYEQYWFDVHGRVVQTGESLRAEHYAQPHGRWYEFFSFKIGPRESRQVGVLFRDITDRKHADVVLKETQEKLKAFLENSALIAWMKDEDGRHVFLSNNYQRRFNITQETWLNKTDFDLWPKEIAEEFRQNDLKVLSSGRTVEVLEKANIDGRLSWWLNSKFRYVDHEGRRFVGGVGVEVAEHQEAQAALEETDRRKDEFIATLAHELRNPLTPIYNAIQVLKKIHGSDDRDAPMLAMIDRQAAHLIRLVDDLLEVSRINSGKIELRREITDLSTIARDALASCGPLIESKEHRVILKVPLQGLCVYGDPVRLAQIIVNLLNNAAKYTPSGGVIEVEAARVGNEIVCRVRDNGVGLPPDKLARVFDLFTQLEGREEMSGGGLGIGLALVQKLVEMHDGHVTAHSEGLGRGSEFVVRLPAYSGAAITLSSVERGEAPMQIAMSAFTLDPHKGRQMG